MFDPQQRREEPEAHALPGEQSVGETQQGPAALEEDQPSGEMRPEDVMRQVLSLVNTPADTVSIPVPQQDIEPPSCKIWQEPLEEGTNTDLEAEGFRAEAKSSRVDQAEGGGHPPGASHDEGLTGLPLWCGVPILIAGAAFLLGVRSLRKEDKEERTGGRLDL